MKNYWIRNVHEHPHNIIRSNRKSIALQIDEIGQLIVRAPHDIPMMQINKFINQKSDWIYKKQQQIIERNNQYEKQREFKDGKVIMFLGKEYEMRLNGRIKPMAVNENFLEFPFKYIDNAEAYLIKWYKKNAKEIFIPRIERYAQKLNLRYKKIGITSAKKRWGSCNTKGNINFSYRLIMTTIDVIDYVIMHELMHLKQMNHSNRFWANLEEFIPDYKQKRKWLKDNQHRFIL